MSLRSVADQAAVHLRDGADDRSLDSFAGVPLPDHFDPRMFLGDPRASGVVASYERPDQDFALVAVGEAARVELAAGESPAAARARALALLDRSPLDGHATATPPLLRPRLLGGFRFAPADAPRAPWEDFAAGSLVLPRMLFVLDGLRAGVVFAPGVPASEALALVERTIADRMDSAPDADPAPLRVAQPIDESAWRRSVEVIASEIRAGDYEKAVLATTVELESDAPLDLGAALARLRAAYPHCHVASFTAGDSTLLCASPELLGSVEAGRVRTLGLASSQRRGATLAEDDALGRQLLADHKSRIEHELVVRSIVERLDGATDDLEVDAEPGLRRFRNIQHLATEITGGARPGVDILDVVERLHPTPAVCGRPRDVAREVIHAHETFDRGWYAGPIGWLGANGEGEFAVALRTALVRGRRATLFAGNGIVAESQPDAEFDEVKLKFRPLAEALGGVAPSERSAIPA